MVKELVIGTKYYFKIKIPTSQTDTPHQIKEITISPQTRYRINNGAWQTRNGNFYFQYNYANEKYRYYNGTWHDLNENDVIEFVGVLSNVTTPLYPFLEKLLLRNAIDNPLTIYPMICNCKDNVVDKAGDGYLDNFYGEIYGVLREECSLLNPSIILEFDTIPVFNYLSIENFGGNEDFSRYYFIKNITSVRKNVWRLDLHEDVLQTFYNNIHNASGFILRNENYLNDKNQISYLVDERLPLLDVMEIENINITPPATNFINCTFNLTTTTQSNIVINAIDKDSVLSQISGNDISSPSSSGLPTIKPFKFDNQLGYSMAITPADWEQVMINLFNNSSWASYVIGVVAFPFDVSSYKIGSVTHDVIVNGNELKQYEWDNALQKWIVTDDNIVGYLLKDLSEYLIIADFNLEQVDYDYAGEFLNYEPYCYFDFYIPFHRWVTIPTKLCYGRILIYYSIDYSTGDGMVYVYNYTTQRIIYSSECSLGIKLPITITNKEELEKLRQANTSNLVLGLVGAGVTTLSSATTNPVGVAMGVLSGVKTIADAINKNAMMIDKASTTIAGGKASLYSNIDVKVVRRYRSPYFAGGQNTPIYASLQGYPINRYTKLSTNTYTFTGYTEIVEMDIPMNYEINSGTMYSLTKDEYDEIKSLARAGIIL